MLRKSLMGMSLVFAAAIVLIAGSVADAQQPRQGRQGRGGLGGFGGIGKIALLQAEQVKTELKITEDQTAKIAEVATAQREARGGRGGEGFRGLQDLSADERAARLAELREAAEKAATELDGKLAAILTAEQNTRLDQILVQLQGVRALTDAKVQEKLGLSDEQKTKITDVLASQREAMGELRELEREERQAKQEEITKATETALNNVLTTAQQAQLAELKGAAFELDRAQLFPGGRRGRGGADGAAPRGRGGRAARGNNT
ncbi:MAG: Spy/CpxP family protein refolding chaperone [Planctomycetaceae bacterium]